MTLTLGRTITLGETLSPEWKWQCCFPPFSTLTRVGHVKGLFLEAEVTCPDFL
jgi:hypothetical protein